MERIKHVIPEGSARARIRATTRVSRRLEDGSIGETLGDEARGMVVVDFDGHPQKFDQLQIMSDVVAKDINVFKVDCPREGTRRGWKRTHSEIDTQELGDKWRDEMAAGSKYIIEETWVKANEPHYDAKLWPVAHPHGTGSVLSEYGSGSHMAHARNRNAMIQNWFRCTALWAFWKLDCVIKNNLFNINSRRRAKGRSASSMEEPDGFARTFGTAIPRNIPESTLASWIIVVWSRDRYAVSFCSLIARLTLAVSGPAIGGS